MKALLKQFIVFCGVGGVNTAVGLSIILLLSEVFEMQYLFANFIGYMTGLCLSYVLHKTITFRSTSATDRIGQQAGRFLMIFAIAYVVQAIVLHLLVGVWGWSNITGQIVACGIYLGLSFIGNRLLTFRVTSS